MRKPFPPSSGVVPKFAPKQREIQQPSAGPAGWFATVKDQMTHLWKDVAGLRKSMERAKEQCVPAALVGSRTFYPQTTSTITVDALPMNYVVKDGEDYAISIQNTYPGVFVAYTMKVKMTFRAFVPATRTGNNAQYMNVPIFPSYIGSIEYRHNVKPPRRYGVAASTFTPADDNLAQLQNVLTFFWNLTDEKSSRKYADTLVPDMILLPGIQPNSSVDIMQSATLPVGIVPPFGPVDGDNFQFAIPWQIERDGQFTFNFRPINPFLQIDASQATEPFGYNDLENGTRNNSVTVQVELHGMRVLQQQDADREGAHVDGSRGYVP